VECRSGAEEFIGEIGIALVHFKRLQPKEILVNHETVYSQQVHYMQKSCRVLSDKKMSAEIINILESPPTEDEIKFMIRMYHGDYKKVLNTSGNLYREMEIKSKIGSMEYTEIIKLLSSHPMLIKRPFLVTESTGIAGFDEEKWKQFTNNKELA
jgi:Spx/MgsR family transcriptional regulator